MSAVFHPMSSSNGDGQGQGRVIEIYDLEEKQKKPSVVVIVFRYHVRSAILRRLGLGSDWVTSDHV